MRCFRHFIAVFVVMSVFSVQFVQADRGQRRFHLRKNPHLKVRKKVSDPIMPKKLGVILSQQTRLDFCLHVRGWAMPTSHFYELMEKTLSKKDFGQPEKELIRDWLDRGLGFAMGRLIEDSGSKHMTYFKNTIKYEYPNTSVICPLACNYRDYVSLLKDLPASEHDRLKTVCAPDCRLKTSIYTPYDRAFCECLVDDKQKICQVLDEHDYQAIKKANLSQAQQMREYEYKTKRRLIDGESAEAIANRREDVLKQVTSTLSRITPF